LNLWNTFYLAGRLHKPVLPIFPPADRVPDDLKIVFSKNLRMALAVSMIILADELEFSDEKLFEIVASLSYAGDFRVGIAENPNKIRNIVFGGNNLDNFRELYHDSFEYFLRTGLCRRTSHGYEVLLLIYFGGYSYILSYVLDLPDDNTLFVDEFVASRIPNCRPQEEHQRSRC
jgi:hypothetical protein